MGNYRSKRIEFPQTTRKKDKTKRNNRASLQYIDDDCQYKIYEPYGCALNQSASHGGSSNRHGPSDVDSTGEPHYAELNVTVEEPTYAALEDNDSVYEHHSQTAYPECSQLNGASNSGSSINSLETVGRTMSATSQDINSNHDDSDDQHKKAEGSHFPTYDYPQVAKRKVEEMLHQEQLSNLDHELQESSHSLYESAARENVNSLAEQTRIEVDEHDVNLLTDMLKHRHTVQCLRFRGIKQAASLPEDIVKMKALQALVFIECTFSDTQEFTENATNLTEQNIVGTLKTPPSIITDLTTLRVLIMKDCQFEALPDDIGDLHQLEVLDISFNKYLDKLPPSMECMIKLTELRLCHCSFEEAPDVIGQLTSLQTIDLSNNRLHSYPHVTLQLKQLTRLDLSNATSETSGNKIEQLPVQIIDSALKWLIIDNNPVIIPPVEVCGKGLGAIRDYLSNARGGDGMHADTIIVVGEPKAGKFSVAKSLAAKRSCQATKKSCNEVLDQLCITVDSQRLVNLSVFGGDQVSQEIIPVLSPAEALMLIVYDMSKEPISEYEKAKGAGSLDDVRKWLTATLMRCTRARFIVVGTRTDAVEKQKRKLLEMLMKEHVADVLRRVETDIVKQQSSLEVCTSSANLQRNIEKLNKRLEAVRKAVVHVVTMSCWQDTDTGIYRLMRAISNTLEPSKPLCDLSRCIITDILTCRYEEGVDLLFLKWEQVEVIYDRHIKDADKIVDIKSILKYLRDTSQVIWTEDHGNTKRLSRYVFHQPTLIANICKSVLELDWKAEDNDRLGLVSPNCLKKSRDGYLRECDLHFHLKKSLRFLSLQPSDTLNVLVELMMHFHIVTEVAEEPCGRLFVNPSHFTANPPADQLALIEKPFMPRIHIKLTFIGSSAHGAYFAANLVAILAWAHSKNVLPVVWKMGVFFKVDGVYVLATQDSEVMDLVACVDSEKDDMWSMVIPILQYLQHTVFTARNDAPPYATVECPGCRCCGQHLAPAGCAERVHTTLGSLCRPLDQCTTISRFCPDCKKDVPTCLIFPCYLEKYTQENQEAVAKFFAELRQTCKYSSKSICATEKSVAQAENCSSDSSTSAAAAEEAMDDYKAPKSAHPSDLVKKVRALRPCLIDALTIEDVCNIVDVLYSKFLISQGQKEQIETVAYNGNRCIAGRRLLDAIENRGHEAATTFINELLSEKIDRKDLVESLHSVQVPS